MDLLEHIQRRATERIQGMECLPHRYRLGELRVFNLEKRRLWKDLRVAFQYLNRAISKKGTDALAGSVAIGQEDMVPN